MVYDPAIGDDRPPVYWEDDILIIRASAIGNGCLWELVAAGQGYEPYPLPDVLVRAFREGHELEPLILEEVENNGVYLYEKQTEAELYVTEKIKIRYHPDGLGIRHEDRGMLVVEAKALSNDLWQIAAKGSVGDVLKEYPWQLSVMMHHKGCPGLWAAYNKGTPPINDMGDRELCADEGKMLYETVDTPPISLADIIEKAVKVYDLVKGEDILEAGRYCDDPNNWPCRYQHLRPQPEDPTKDVKMGRAFKIVDNNLQEEVDRLTREYLHNKGIVDEAMGRRDNAKQRLIDIAGESGGLTTDRWRIPVVNGHNTSTDWGAMTPDDKRAVKGILDKYKKKTEYKYLRGIKRLD